MTMGLPRDPVFRISFDFRRDSHQIFNCILLDKPIWQEIVSEKGSEFLASGIRGQRCEEEIRRVSLPGVEAKDVEINTMEHVNDQGGAEITL